MTFFFEWKINGWLTINLIIFITNILIFYTSYSSCVKHELKVLLKSWKDIVLSSGINWIEPASSAVERPVYGLEWPRFCSDPGQAWHAMFHRDSFSEAYYDTIAFRAQKLQYLMVLTGSIIRLDFIFTSGTYQN